MTGVATGRARRVPAAVAAVPAVVAILAVLTATPLRAEDAKPWWALVPDTYDGEIYSGFGFAKGATEFHLDKPAAASPGGTGAGTGSGAAPDAGSGAGASGGGNGGAAARGAAGPGALAGSYAFVEANGGQVEGTLFGCRSAEALSLACRWRDRYGEGTVLFVFEEGLQAFQGLWFSPKVPKQGMPWRGRRRLEG
jgi:hypothetical protein